MHPCTLDIDGNLIKESVSLMKISLDKGKQPLSDSCSLPLFSENSDSTDNGSSASLAMAPCKTSSSSLPLNSGLGRIPAIASSLASPEKMNSPITKVAPASVQDLISVTVASPVIALQMNSRNVMFKDTADVANLSSHAKSGPPTLSPNSFPPLNVTGISPEDDPRSIKASMVENLVNSAAVSSAMEKNTIARPMATNAWQVAPPLDVSETYSVADISPDGIYVDMDDDEISSNVAKLENAIVGKLLGKSIPFLHLKRELVSKWGHLGKFQLKMLEANCFMCIFESRSARDQILCGGPWIVFGSILGLDVWTPQFSASSHTGFSSPIWVRFPNLPLVFWDAKNITRMATMLGKPILLDAHINDWERSNFARVCIRMDLSVKLPTGVWLRSRFGRFFQKVEYEGVSHLCFKCGVVGHTAANCPTQVNKPKSPSLAATSTPSSRGLSSDMELDALRRNDVIASSDGNEKASSTVTSSTCSDPPSTMLMTQPLSASGGNQVSFPPDFSGEMEQDSYGPWTLVTRKNFRSKGKSSRVAAPVKGPASSGDIHPKTGVLGPSPGLRWQRVTPNPPLGPPAVNDDRPSGTAISNFSSLLNKVNNLVNSSSAKNSISHSKIGGDASPLVSNG